MDQNPIENVENKPILDEKTAVIVQMPATEAMSVKGQAAIKRLIESKSIKEKEKKKEIIETHNLNELDLEAILSKDDYEYYKEKKQLYLNQYPDLTDPFDLDNLHLMIMEQIFQRNLLRRQKKHPHTNIAKDYESSVKRQNEQMKSLSMRRTDRVKDKENKKSTVNIANLSMNFQDSSKLNEYQQRLLENRMEEEKLRTVDAKICE